MDKTVLILHIVILFAYCLCRENIDKHQMANKNKTRKFQSNYNQTILFENCGKTINFSATQSSRLITLTKNNDPYKSSFNCSVNLNALNYYGFVINIKIGSIDIWNKSEEDSSCDDNIQITSHDDDDERRFNISHMICSLNSSFQSHLILITNSSKLKIKFTNTSNNNNHIGLELYLNSYDKGERCTSQSQNFKCDNQNCINKRLVCDGINNCDDKSDEKGCDDRTARISLLGYVAITSGLMLVFAILIMLIQTAPRSARDRARMGLLLILNSRRHTEESTTQIYSINNNIELSWDDPPPAYSNSACQIDQLDKPPSYQDAIKIKHQTFNS